MGNVFTVRKGNREVSTSIVALDSPKQVLETLSHPVVLEFQAFMFNYVRPRFNKVIVLPCAASKIPSYKYSPSLSYRTVFRLQREYKNFDVFTLSEPLGLHPSDWFWLSESEWKPRLGILPFYNVTGLFKRIKSEGEFYRKCIKRLGRFVSLYVNKFPDIKWLFLVKPHKSHGDMVCSAFGLKKFSDCERGNIKILGERVLDVKNPRHLRSYNFVKLYEREIIRFCEV